MFNHFVFILLKSIWFCQYILMIESRWSLHLQMYISNLGENALVANIIEYNKKMQLTLVCGDLNPSSFVVIFRLGYVIYLPIKQQEIRLPRISSCFCIRSKQIRTAVNFKKRDIEIKYVCICFECFLNHSRNSNIWRKNLISRCKNYLF